LDSLGAIVGGVLFTFILVHFFSPFGVLAVPAALNLLVALTLGWRTRQRELAGVALATGMGLAFLLAGFDLEGLLLGEAVQHPDTGELVGEAESVLRSPAFAHLDKISTRQGRLALQLTL
jgi:hypothetical protein